MKLGWGGEEKGTPVAAQLALAVTGRFVVNSVEKDVYQQAKCCTRSSAPGCCIQNAASKDNNCRSDLLKQKRG